MCQFKTDFPVRNAQNTNTTKFLFHTSKMIDSRNSSVQMPNGESLLICLSRLLVVHTQRLNWCVFLCPLCVVDFFLLQSIIQNVIGSHASRHARMMMSRHTDQFHISNANENKNDFCFYFQIIFHLQDNFLMTITTFPYTHTTQNNTHRFYLYTFSGI